MNAVFEQQDGFYMKSSWLNSVKDNNLRLKRDMWNSYLEMEDKMKSNCNLTQ